MQETQVQSGVHEAGNYLIPFSLTFREYVPSNLLTVVLINFQFLRDKIGTVIKGQWDTADRSAVYTTWFLEKEKIALSTMLQELKEYGTSMAMELQRVQRPLDELVLIFLSHYSGLRRFMSCKPAILCRISSFTVWLEESRFLTCINMLSLTYCLFIALCDVLSKDQELPGVFKGINEQGVFVPRPYKEQQAEMIESFFRNNGFIGMGFVSFDAMQPGWSHRNLTHTYCK